MSELYEYVINGADDGFDVPSYTVQITNWVEKFRQTHYDYDFIDEAIATKSYFKPEEYFILAYEIELDDELINDDIIRAALEHDTPMQIFKSKQNILFVYGRDDNFPFVEIRDIQAAEGEKYIFVQFSTNQRAYEHHQDELTSCIERIRIINENLVYMAKRNCNSTSCDVFYDSNFQQLTKPSTNQENEYIAEYDFIDGTWH